MNYSFHPEAKTEFKDSIAYYKECSKAVGLDFALEVHETIRSIVNYPTLWHEIEPDVRRCLVNRFPYGILYSIEPEGVLILAVMNLHRDPDYWKNRI